MQPAPARHGDRARDHRAGQAKPATTPGAKPKAAKKKAAPAVKGVPPKVAKALQKRRTVVLFFRQPAADDDATAAAVRSVRGIKNVSVFTAPITKLARYRRVVNDLGVTQAPAVVIVGKDRKARLLEGYIDPVTLRQQVKDGDERGPAPGAWGAGRHRSRRSSPRSTPPG